MSFVQLWIAGTVLLVAVMFLWAFAPIVVFLLLLAGGLGVVVAAIVWGARQLERRRGG